MVIKFLAIILTVTIGLSGCGGGGGGGGGDGSGSGTEPAILSIVGTNRGPVASMVDPVIVSSSNSRLELLLNGSSSSDPDNDPLTYSWSVRSAPPSATTSLTRNNTATTNLVIVNPVAGIYTIEFFVTDRGGVSDGIILSITLNNPPIADAGLDRLLPTFASVILDGTGSFEPDNQNLSYSWSIISQPVGANITLNSRNTATPTFSSAIPGEYVLELTVRDSFGSSDTDRVKITLVHRPVVQIGAIQYDLTIGDSITFDTTGTFDPAGYPLSYIWRLVSSPEESGIPVTYSGPAPNIVFDVPGGYVLELEVSNGLVSTIERLSSIDVTVYESINLPFVKDVDYDEINRRVAIAVTDKVFLINIDTGSESIIDLTAQANAISVTADGNHAVVAHDGWISYLDLATESVIAVHSVPADLGDIVIDNNGYAYGFPRTGEWTRIYVVNLATGATQTNTGDEVRELTRAKLHPDGTRIYGADNEISPGDIERYSIGGGSAHLDYDSPYHGDHDFCGDLWIEPAGELILTNCHTVVRSTNVQSTDMTFVMQLDIDEKRGLITSADMNAATGEWLVLDRVNHNLDDGPQYVQTYNRESGLPGRQFMLPRLLFRRWIGQYVFATQNQDEHIVIASDRLENPGQYYLFKSKSFNYPASNRAPKATVPRFKTTRVFQNVNIDGSASSDPENMPLTYRWSIISEPAGSSITLLNANSPEVMFTPQVPGVYELGLIVNDGVRNSTMVRTDVNVFNSTENLVHRLTGSFINDIEYSSVLNSLVYTIQNDSSLYILNLGDFSQKKIRFAQEPRRVGISPDGINAAVSHTGKVSLVNLQTATLLDSQTYPDEWGDIVLDHNNRAHVIPYRDQSVSFYSLDFNANTFSSMDIPRADTQLYMHPSRNLVIGGAEQSGFEMYNVESFPSTFFGYSYQSSSIGGFRNAWGSENGTKLISTDSAVFDLNFTPAPEINFTRLLPDHLRILWAAHSIEAAKWAVLTGPDSNPNFSLKNSLFIYSDGSFNRFSRSGFTNIPTPQGSVEALMTYNSRVFFNADGTRLIIITYNGSLVNSYAVEIRPVN